MGGRGASTDDLPRPERRAASARALASLLLLAAAGNAAAALTSPQQAKPRGPRARVDPAEAFLRPWGHESFPEQYVDALSAWLRAKAAREAGDDAGAKEILDALWAEHPIGHTSWGSLPTQPFGLNVGSPACYYALRMLTDTVEWSLANPGHGPGLRTARLTVILVGSSSGIEPQNLQDLQQGTGVFVEHELDPLLLEADSRVVHRSLELFREYVLAATQGALEVETHILHLPAVELDVHAEIISGRKFAGLTDPTRIFFSVPAQDRRETDWWWILYPSHVPEQHPDFQGTEFITGGMGVGPESRSPYFIIDDRWLVRKPPHIGTGPYSAVEREAYLPQWLQHEFFHHLFRTYPEFGLEETPHQWFDLGTWPPDFVGRYEPDYFHEALEKRLQGAAVPMVAALRYATADAPWHLFDVNDVLGSHQRNPVENDWHIGSIQVSPQLEWQNQAGVDWNLTDNLPVGELLTGPDCPYFAPNQWAGRRFHVELQRDALGDLQPVLEGFRFLGELYERTGP